MPEKPQREEGSKTVVFPVGHQQKHGRRENFNAYDSFGSYVTPETPLETQNTNQDESNTNSSSSSSSFSFVEIVHDPLTPALKKKRKSRPQDKSEES
jgi:hypothetical protein